ncbi:MAG: hypothetical protein K9H49_00655 [Bacteroidales bacterium]|nr:hypothetical protein [Bacteroidales bacterium]MCF8389865.1 hypothetical protein [Bacteroidales bacterium]
MYFFKNKSGLLILLLIIPFVWTCKQDTQWKGQGPIKKVSTETVPIQLQYKGVFDLGDGVFISNDYDGARLNGVARINDTLISVLITPENSPINMSPWYGFKIWSELEKNIAVKLTYAENAYNRYYPKISKDGSNWEAIDSSKYQVVMENRDGDAVPANLTMQISVSTDTTWISAQELITVSEVNGWMDELLSNSFVSKSIIGRSRDGRPINLLKIGESDDQKMIIVLSRQHPPEVTGFLAMESFIETICTDIEIAKKFRAEYNVYVVPMINPDGVSKGHWRHNSGGVDLNRDWESFNQPETSAIRDFMKQKVTQTGGVFYFGIDFHSTSEDIFYTNSSEQNVNMPGLVIKLIDAVGNEFPNYTPNVRPSTETGTMITSTSFIFYEYGAEALTYEVGDNTPREFVNKKGEVTALKLMELMTK